MKRLDSGQREECRSKQVVADGFAAMRQAKIFAALSHKESSAENDGAAGHKRGLRSPPVSLIRTARQTMKIVANRQPVEIKAIGRPSVSEASFTL